MNPLENQIDKNIELGLLKIEDVPQYGFEYCSRPDYYKWVIKEIDPDSYKFNQQLFDEARTYLKKCGKPKNEGEIYMAKYYKNLQSELKDNLSGVYLYQHHQKQTFEKTDKYKILVLQNYINSLTVINNILEDN